MLVSTSNRIVNINQNQPVQGHLALTEDPSKMLLVVSAASFSLLLLKIAFWCCLYSLQWVTKNATDSQVQWGTVSGKYDQTNKVRNMIYVYKYTTYCMKAISIQLAFS